jgi:hypothetical protein
MNGPPMNWLDIYRGEAFEQIEGWLVPDAIDMIESLDGAQASLGVEGGVMEIGIHHGKFFIALNGLVEDPAVPSLAIDLFEDQALNIDRSGEGIEAVFRENLRQYDRHKGANVIVKRADSTTLEPEEVLSELSVRPRIVSIDGGHTPEHTISDIELAHAVLAPRGAIVIDDILNAQWLGVIEGVVLYLSRRPKLWPVAIGHNKLVLAPMTMHGHYQGELSERLHVWGTVDFCSYEVLFVGGRFHQGKRYKI